jgi:hypothetical protein
MSKIQVDLNRIKDAKTGKERVYKYSDIPKKNGWADAEVFLPIPFDLMHVKEKSRPKELPAWWNGQNWVIPRLRCEYTVTQWKREFEHD